jgi:ABC-type transport system involved in cytochrome bd biosynthesis fused ATPase/permease subunit
VDALEVYLARYLPQVVLAVAVPVAVLVVTLAIDPDVRRRSCWSRCRRSRC